MGPRPRFERQRVIWTFGGGGQTLLTLSFLLLVGKSRKSNYSDQNFGILKELNCAKFNIFNLISKRKQPRDSGKDEVSFGNSGQSKYLFGNL